MGCRLQRAGEPQRMRALTEGGAIYQVPLTVAPDRLWRSLFLDQKEFELDFVPALVRFTYHPPTANFQSEESQLRRRLRLLDAWIEATNRRVAPPLPGRAGETHGSEHNEVPES